MNKFAHPRYFHVKFPPLLDDTSFDFDTLSDSPIGSIEVAIDLALDIGTPE